jgi:DNA-binding FadR family transcriptional regulator
MQNKLMEEIYRLAFEMFSPTILENYMVGQVDMDRDLTIENHRLIVEAIEKRDVYTGIHAIKVSTKLWKKWAEKNQYKMNGKESAFKDYSATVDPTI